MGFDQLFDDRQAQTGAMGALMNVVFQLHEGFENPLDVLRGNADAGIGDDDLQCLGIG